MKFHSLLNNLIVYFLLLNIKHFLVFVHGSSITDIPEGDPYDKIPVVLDMSVLKSTSQITYTKSPDSMTHTFRPADGYGIKEVNFTDNSGKLVNFWSSPNPATKAYKVVGYVSGARANNIEIHLFSGAVVSVYHSYYSSRWGEKSTEESVIVGEDPKDSSINKKKDSSNSSSTPTSNVNYKILYIVIPVVIGAVAIVLGIVMTIIYRRKRHSLNLLASETVV